MLEDLQGVFEREFVADGFLYACKAYQEHNRSKNWVALITGKSATFKFKREFKKFMRIDGAPYIELEECQIYQYFFCYYTGRGNESGKVDGFLRVNNDGSLKALTEREVLEELAERINGEKNKPERLLEVKNPTVNILAKYSDEELLFEVKRRGLIKEGGMNGENMVKQ